MSINEFEKIEMPVLVDMLSDHTASYSKMLSEGGNTADIQACEAKIILLQNEINSRKQFSENTTVSKPDADYSNNTSYSV